MLHDVTVESFFADDVAFIVSLIPIVLLLLIVIASLFESRLRVLKAKPVTQRVHALSVVLARLEL